MTMPLYTKQHVDVGGGIFISAKGSTPYTDKNT